jgi:DNA-binding NarL/FixJ family response regulator
MECGSVRVAVQSQQRLMRDVFAASLQARPEFTVVGHTSGLAELVTLCALRRPDVVLVDLRAPTRDFAPPLRALRDSYPDIGVVGVYDEPGVLAKAGRAGMATAVPASHGLDALFALLRTHAGRPPRPGGDRLTDDELDVVWLMNSGHSVAEIADVLGIGPRTVENRKRRIYAKLDVHSQSHAMARTASLGLTRRGRYRSAPVAEADRALLVVVRGPAGSGTDRVVGALVSHGVPFVLDRTRTVSLREYPAGWYSGPMAAVLVEPQPADWLASDALGMPILVVHPEHPDRTVVVEALERGAAAVVAVEEVAAHLVPVLAVVARGYVAIRAAGAAPLVERMAATHSLPALTARETDILLSVQRGESVRQTARALGIAAKTVENTQARMFRKLGVRNRVGALAIAHRLGLLIEARRDGNPLGPVRRT